MRVLITLSLVSGMLALAALGASADTSGPDSSGYHWIDSNSPEPTTEFEWIEISETGTALENVTDTDDAAQLVPLPFPFTYFGETYADVVVSSNGFLSFDLSDVGNTKTVDGCNDNYNWGVEKVGVGLPIPQPDTDCEGEASGWGANPLVAVWFDDMDPGECGDIWSQTLSPARQGAGRMFIVEWKDVCHNDCDKLCEAGNGVTYEVILYEGSNDIRMQYMDTFFGTGVTDMEQENFGMSATTGLAKDEAVGLQYSYAEPALTEDLAVLYRAGDPGLKGDTDCDEDVDSVDALWDLRDLAGLSVDAKCLDQAGNVDCDEDIDSVDALFILRNVAGLPVTLPKGCSAIGEVA